MVVGVEYAQPIISAAAAAITAASVGVAAKTWSKVRVLDDIVRQFRSDSGSSLRDVVDRLEVGATLNADAAQRLAATVDLLSINVGRLAVKVASGAAGVERIETGRAAQAAAANVAVATGAHPGDAADAAAIVPTTPPQ